MKILLNSRYSLKNYELKLFFQNKLNQVMLILIKFIVK